MQSSSSLSTSSSQSRRSPRAQHAIDWIAAFTCWDLGAIYSLTTSASDFQYAYLPAAAGIAPKGMKEWHLYNTQMKTLLPDFWVEVLNLYESTGESGAVIAHIVGRATSRTGAPFHQEYIMIIHIREEYPNSLASTSSHTTRPDTLSSSLITPVARTVLKVYRVFEFVDTRFAATFFPEEKERSRSQRQQQQKSKGTREIQQPVGSVEFTRMVRSNAGASDQMRLAKL